MERLAQRRQQLGQREEQLRDDTIKFNAFLKVGAGSGPGSRPCPSAIPTHGISPCCRPCQQGDSGHSSGQVRSGHGWHSAEQTP